VKIIRKYGAICAALGMLTVQPANACWDNAATNALKIKHLNTMLMATALRCRNTSNDFLPQYNAFVQTHNDLLGKQNNIVRIELAEVHGNGGAIARSDNLSVGYANAYGAGHPYMDCAALKLLAMRLGNSPSDVAAFSQIADDVLNETAVPGAVCRIEPTKIASK
jgi:hypothetical protein